MRQAATTDRIVMGLLAGILLAPLLSGFGARGSFGEVYSLAAPADGASPFALLIHALARSSWIGLGATLVAVLIGVPAGWALARQRRGAWFLAFCALPLALAPSVAVGGWLHWFAPGFVRSAFGVRFEQPQEFITPLFSAPAVALILGVGLWPVVAFECWPAFRRARGEAYEAALLAGSPSRAFFRVALPMARGELAAGALLVFLLAVSDFTAGSLLLVRTLPIVVNDYLALNRAASAAWAALPLVLLVLAAGWMLMRLRVTLEEARSQPAPRAEAAALRSGSRWPEVILGIGLGLGFVLPLSGCLHGALAGGKSWELAFGAGLPALGISVRLALAAAIAAALLGALRVVAWPESRALALRAAGLLLLAVPGSFLAAGLLSATGQGADLFDALGAEGLLAALPGGWLVACGLVLRFVYLPLRLAEEGLASLDPVLLEAAELAGHRRFSRGLNIALPQVWGHLLAAGALVFVLCLGEVPLAQVLAPPGAVPASVWLFGQQHLGYTEEVFALSLLLGAAAMSGLLLAGAAARWMSRGAWRTP